LTYPNVNHSKCLLLASVKSAIDRGCRHSTSSEPLPMKTIGFHVSLREDRSKPNHSVAL